MNDEAFEYFMEVKNNEIKELKEKLQKTKEASNAMINAAISNQRRLIEIGEKMADWMSMEIETPPEHRPSRNKIINEWDREVKKYNR